VSTEIERPEQGLVITLSPGEVRAGLLEQGKLVELTVTRRDRASHVGDVFRARVTKVDEAIRGAFLDLGSAGSGFLGFEAGGAEISEGERILAQVKRDAENGKPLSLSRRIELAGRLAVYLPGGTEIAASRRLPPPERRRLAEEAAALARPGEGWQLRTAASVAPPKSLAAEMAALRDLASGWSEEGAPGLVHAEPGAVARALHDTLDLELDQVLIDDALGLKAAEEWCRRWRPDLLDCLMLWQGPEDLFETLGLEAEIEQALSIRLTLEGGGALIIERTRALTSIDVDRGSAQDQPSDINARAALELVRQLRLRDIGGMILVDFLRMRGREERDALLQILRDEARYDPLGLDIMGFTRAGLVEIVRPRRRAGLAELMLQDCLPCAGIGSVRHPEAAAYQAIRAVLREQRHDPAARLSIAAAPDIAAAFAGPAAGALAEAGERLGRAIAVTSDPALAPDRYELRRGA
jgi:ribonuclease G